MHGLGTDSCDAGSVFFQNLATSGEWESDVSLTGQFRHTTGKAGNLHHPLRFIDHAPRSRNELLADLMRRLGICEERGSGFDKVVFEVQGCPNGLTEGFGARVQSISDNPDG